MTLIKESKISEAEDLKQMEKQLQGKAHLETFPEKKFNL